MLRRSRVATSPDLARIGNALARPGMDTRVWCSLAYVVKVVIDPEHGPIADIVLSPSGLNETARVAAEYAGNGWGMYAPLYPDDEVLVEATHGDPDDGLIITKRLWSAADPPPPEMVDEPDTFLLHIKDGARLRIKATGAGEVVIDSPMTFIGGDADAAIARAPDLKTAYDVHMHNFIGVPPGVSAITLQPTIPLPETVFATKGKVK